MVASGERLKQHFAAHFVYKGAGGGAGTPGAVGVPQGSALGAGLGAAAALNGEGPHALVRHEHDQRDSTRGPGHHQARDCWPPDVQLFDHNWR